MKTLAIEDLPNHVGELEKAASGRLLLTKKGKPFAFVTDASNLDEEDLGYINDDKFWEMIAQRRKEKGGYTLVQMFARLEKRERRERRTTNGHSKAKKKGN